MKRAKSVGVILLVGVVVIAGGWWMRQRRATPRAAAPDARRYQGLITIGTETWTGYLPLYVARDRGYFRDEGLQVAIKRYIALGQLSKDYVAGAMQGRANLTLDMVNEALQGLDHKAILAIDYSNGSDAIVARQEVSGLAALRGKRVAYEPNTLEEFFIAWALKEVGLSLADLQSVSANPEDAAKQLADGRLDVAVSHEPFLSQMLQSKQFHVLYSSANAPGLITDVLTFRTDFLQAHPETAQALVRAYFKALRFWREHPDDAHRILAKEFGDTPEGIAKQLEGIKMLDEADNNTAFTFAAGLQSLYGNLRQIGAFVLNHQGGPARTLDTDQLIERRFVKQLIKSETPAP